MEQSLPPRSTNCGYARHHLLKALVARESGDSKKSEQEFDNACDHCNRAMNKALEAGVGYYFDLIEEPDRDYGEFNISQFAPA